jgi:alpha-tubulin suppressor-like RCC1 family protein
MTTLRNLGFASIGKKLSSLVITIALTFAGLVAAPTAANAAGAIQKIVVGSDHMCALMVDGSVDCLGNNSTGELGNGTTVNSTSPVRVYGITNAVDISAGNDFSCAVLADGNVRCWGSGAWGQLGNGQAFAGYFSSTPVAASTSGALQVTSEKSYSCVKKITGQSACWGVDYSVTTNNSGYTAVENGTAISQSGMPTSAWAARLCTWTAGSYSATTYRCGSNGGAKGIGTQFGLITTPQLHPQGSNIIAIAIGGNASYVPTVSDASNSVYSYSVSPGFDNSVCFLRADNTLYCTGILSAGNGLQNVVSVAAGNQHACAVIADGAIKCWGNNALGQLGNAGIVQAGVTVYQVSGISSATEVFADGDHTCAITSEGRVYCWGLGSSGELGQGTTANANVPQLVIGVEAPSTLVLGPQSTCSVNADMTFKCWGLNTSGQLFQGNSTNSLAPQLGLDFEIIQVNTPTPTISGRPTEGQLLTATAGVWDEGMRLTFQWLRGSTAIDGATTSTYRATALDVGQTVSVVVTSQKSGYRTEQRTSSGFGPIEASQVSTPLPSISGSAKVGTTLTASIGSWDSGVVTTIQWLKNGVAISGANSSTYSLTAADLSARIAIRVTGSKPSVTTVIQQSDPTEPVVPGTLGLTPTPTVTGIFAVGKTLTLAPGTWDSGVTLSYQWFRGPNAILNATAQTYQIAPEDFGQPIRATVTGAKIGYDSATVSSVPSLEVTSGSITTTPTPVISGLAAAGQTLSVVPGSWDTGTVLAYKWMKNGTEIPGQTSNTYFVTPEDLDSNISVAVTGYKLGYTPITRTSLATISVVLGSFGQTATPVITGSTTVGSQLMATVGNWDPGVNLSFQWLRDGIEIPSQTGTTYVLAVSDRGHTFTFQTTATKAGFNTQVLSSAASASIGYGVFSQTPVPTLNGTFGVGGSLGVSAGIWDEGTALTYQWLRSGAPIPGETGSTYQVLAIDRGLTISAVVTGAKSGFTSVSKTSSSTTIGYGALALTPTPIVVGAPIVGGTLVASPGTWDVDTTFTYQWLRSGIAISGATTSSYILTPTDRGATITVTVVGSKLGYTSISKTSAATSAVDYGVQVNQPVPQISGVAAVGNVLTAVPGTWDSGVVLTYQWYRGGVAISGATSTTLTLTSPDRGNSLSVSVTASKTAYTAVTLTSAPTVPVDFGTPTLTPSPTLSGTLNVGNTLSVTAGTWDSGTTFTYQWSRSGTPISGATSTTYVLVADDYGSDISVAVTGNRTGYNSVTRFVTASSPIDFGSLSLTPVPTISGTVKVGITLSAVTGTWDSGTTLTYRWFRDGVERLGLATSTYTLASADFGRTISVTVTGFKPGYRSVSKASAVTASVATGTQTLQPTPTISGTFAVGQTLTANSGIWDSGVLISYQWVRGGTDIAGATDYLYTVRPEDRNSALAVRVIGTKLNYADVSKTSGLTGIIGYGTLVASPTPLILGTARVGDAISAVAGYWDDGATLAYQWQRNGREIAGATAANYVVAGDDFNTALTVTVTGSKDGYTPVVRTSSATAAVIAGPFVLFSTPTIEGNVGLGERLTARPGSWDSGAIFTYQWQRDGISIPGATDSTYVTNTGDLGKDISVAVTATKTGYVTKTLTSDRTSTINPLDITIAPVPTIAGVASVGSILTATVGAWSPGVAVGIQWYRGGTAIAGATGSTYLLTDADEGLQMTVVTTGTKTGYDPLSQESEPTAEVLEGTIVRAPVPVITGAAKVGSTLVGIVGTWDAGVTLSYQWFRAGDPIDGANNNTYVLQADDAGFAMTFGVVGSRSGYTPKSVVSRATAAVAMGTLVMAQPRVTGSAIVGQTLTATHQDANVPEAEYSVQWYRSGVAIPGAVDWTYDLTATDLGKTMNVKVTVTFDGYKDLILASPKTLAVGLGVITIRGEIVLNGATQPLVGSQITTTIGAWEPGTTIAYAWKRNGVAISGARASSYTPVAADRGKKLTLTLTVTKPGFKTVTVTTPATPKVL